MRICKTRVVKTTATLATKRDDEVFFIIKARGVDRALIKQMRLYLNTAAENFIILRNGKEETECESVGSAPERKREVSESPPSRTREAWEK